MNKLVLFAMVIFAACIVFVSVGFLGVFAPAFWSDDPTPAPAVVEDPKAPVKDPIGTFDNSEPKQY